MPNLMRPTTSARLHKRHTRLALTAGIVALSALLTAPLLAQTAAKGPELNVPDLNVPNLSTPAAPPAATPQAQPQAPRPKLGEAIIATVNDDIVSSYDLRQRLLLLIVTSGVQVTEESYPTYEQQALRDLIDQHLQLQEMNRFEVKVDDSEINEEIDRMASQSNMSAPQLLAALKSSGIDPNTLKNQVKAEIGWNMLVNGRFRSRAKVGHEQVDAVMEKLTLDSQKPQYEVALIYLDPNSNGGLEQARAGAQQLYTQIAKGVAPFQAVARQFSNAPSAANGGEEGWMVSGAMDPKVEDILRGLEKGQMTAPILSDDGVYIYYLRDKTNGNADSAVTLKQAAIRLPADASEQRVAEAQKALTNYRSRAKGCSTLTSNAGNDITVSDLGETDLSALQPAYEQALKPLKEGESTAPLRNSVNMNVLFVCEKRIAGENAPTKDSIESRMVQQRVAMLGRRYLRDVRTSATIENH
jgi:peptidyl-prolyl cis-trans isomerase SurA